MDAEIQGVRRRAMEEAPPAVEPASERGFGAGVGLAVVLSASGVGLMVLTNSLLAAVTGWFVALLVGIATAKTRFGAGTLMGALAVAGLAGLGALYLMSHFNAGW